MAPVGITCSRPDADRRRSLAVSSIAHTDSMNGRSAGRGRRLNYYRFLNVTRRPPWALLVTPSMLVPSADNSPAKFHGCVFGNVKVSRRPLIVKPLSEPSDPVVSSDLLIGTSRGSAASSRPVSR